MSFCSNIFSSKRYDITGVSVTYKKNIGQWVALQNRVEETRDSRSARGNPIIHDSTRPHAHIRDRTPVDGHGKRTSKIISFMKEYDRHTQGIFLTSRPALPFIFS